MSTPLLDALAVKDAFLKCEEPLLKQAKYFYGLGFNPDNLTASQMAAVADLLKAAGTLAEAQEAISKFLDNQLMKLLKKEKDASWAVKITVEGEEKRLGEVLHSWVRDWCQSSLGEAQFHLDCLAALRSFWTYVYGQYSYQKTCREPMKLGREETAA